MLQMDADDNAEPYKVGPPGEEQAQPKDAPPVGQSESTEPVLATATDVALEQDA